LQPLQQLVANTSQQTVAAVQSIADKSMNKCLVRIRRQWLFDRPEPAQVEETGSAECRNLIGHGELPVEQDTKVVNNRWERNRGVLQF